MTDIKTKMYLGEASNPSRKPTTLTIRSHPHLKIKIILHVLDKNDSHPKTCEFYSLRHLNDPIVFSHKSSSVQLCVAVVHSSTSNNGDNIKQDRYVKKKKSA